MERQSIKDEESEPEEILHPLTDSEKLDQLLEQMTRLNVKLNKHEEEIKKLKGKKVKIEPLAKGGFKEEEEDLSPGHSKSNPIDLTNLRKIAFKDKKKSRGQHEKDELIEQLEAAEEDGLDDSSETVKKIKKRLQTIIFAEETDWRTHASIKRLQEAGISQSEINDVAHFKTAFGQRQRGQNTRGRGNFRGRPRYNKERGTKNPKKE